MRHNNQSRQRGNASRARRNEPQNGTEYRGDPYFPTPYSSGNQQRPSSRAQYRPSGRNEIYEPTWGLQQGWNRDRLDGRDYSEGMRNEGQYGSAGNYQSESEWGNQYNQRGNLDIPSNRSTQDYNGHPNLQFDYRTDDFRNDYGSQDFNNRQESDNRWGSDSYGSSQYRGKGPKGYQRSDERIQEDINDRLTDHSRVDASEIEVKVERGEVTLSGTVSGRNEKRHAEEIAESVSGVKNVENRIRLSDQSKEQGKSANGTSARSERSKQRESVA